MNTKNWYDEYETRTLADLREAGEAMEYIDGSDDDDLFIAWSIINPENKQKIITAWVPVDIVAECEYDIQRTRTQFSYSWSNTIADYLSAELDEIDRNYCGDEARALEAEAITEAVKELKHHVYKYGSLLSSVIDEDSFNF